MTTIQEIFQTLEPLEALEAIAPLLKEVFGQVGEEVRLQFLMGLVDESNSDKVASLVHL